MNWGRPVKIDTALYRISTQRNLAVAPDDISMHLNPDLYSRLGKSFLENKKKINRNKLLSIWREPIDGGKSGPKFYEVEIASNPLLETSSPDLCSCSIVVFKTACWGGNTT